MKRGRERERKGAETKTAAAAASKLPNRVVRSDSHDEASFGGPSLFAFTLALMPKPLSFLRALALGQHRNGHGCCEIGATHWENHPTLRQSSARGAPRLLTRLPPAVAFPWSDHYVCNEAIVLRTVTKYEDRAPSSLSVGPVVRPSGVRPRREAL